MFVEEDKEAAEMVALYKGALNQITGTPIWLKWHGDINGDGNIDSWDLAIIINAIRTGVYNYDCDLNGDGVVDDKDLDVFEAHYGQKVHVVGEDKKLMENDIIVVGGDYPNPYAKFYFKDPGLVKWNETIEKMEGEGVYADGQRYIRTIQRANGTLVTGIWGVLKEDTYEAVKDYVGVGAPIDLKTLGIAGAVITSAIGTGYAISKVFKK